MGIRDYLWAPLPQWFRTFRCGALRRIVSRPVFLYMLLATGFGSITFAANAPLSLPPGTTTPTVTAATDQSLASFVQIQFTDLLGGYDVSDGTYLGWCAEQNALLLVSDTSPGSPLYSENNAIYRMARTYPDPSADPNPAWPLVNWLLNHKQGQSGAVAATVLDIQEAIWFLLQGSYLGGSQFTGSFNPSDPTSAAVQLVSDATTYGAGFVPTPGEIVAVLLVGVSQPGNTGPPQNLIIEVKAPQVEPWPMFHQNPSRTGTSPADTTNNKGMQKWVFTTGGVVYSSPAVDLNGIIYVGSTDNNLYAVKPDGTQKWKFTTGSSIHSSPAVDLEDKIIYVGSRDDFVYAIKADGTHRSGGSRRGMRCSRPRRSEGMALCMSHRQTRACMRSSRTGLRSGSTRRAIRFIRRRLWAGRRTTCTSGRATATYMRSRQMEH